MQNKILIAVICFLALYLYPHRPDLQRKTVYDFNHFASSGAVEAIEFSVADHSFAFNSDNEEFKRYIQLIGQSSIINYHQPEAEYFKLKLKGEEAEYTARLTFADYKMNSALKNLVTLIAFRKNLND